MATPLTADKFMSVLKNAGLGVVEHGGWRTHNRNQHGNWGPVNGVMIHHTGAYSSEDDMVELCRTGYNDLPGPLCHGVIDRSGTIHLVGYGRTNHAGMGDTDVLLAVIAEKVNLPSDNEADTDGNRHFYGFECINTGTGQAWPSAQLDAMARAAAAVCKAHGWNEHSVIGHKEWQPGKIDPHGIDMAKSRARVAKHLAGSGNSSSSSSSSTKSKDSADKESDATKKVQSASKPKNDEQSDSAYVPFQGADYFGAGRDSPLIAAMGKRLVAEGCNAYPSEPGSTWNAAHRRSYAAWQLKRGFSGTDTDGIPGRTSWDKLHVPNPQSAEDETEKKTITLPQSLADTAERTVMTYAESLLGLLIASRTTALVDLSALGAAAVSTMPAALSALKSTAGTLLGQHGTASWLPFKRDPAS
ncbi:peptidoglycan-binding protein [Streptomyces sp. NPDC001220]